MLYVYQDTKDKTKVYLVKTEDEKEVEDVLWGEGTLERLASFTSYELEALSKISFLIVRS